MLSTEAEKELALAKRKLQDAYIGHIDPKRARILVILPSTHLPTGILMQKEDCVLEWIFLARKQNKNQNLYRKGF